MKTFNFDFAAFAAAVTFPLLNVAGAQDAEPATITVLAPDSSFLFDNVNNANFVYTDVTPKGVAIDGQTTYAGLAVGAAEYVTTEPLLNKVAIATTTFTWSVGIVADASHAEYGIFETGGAQLLDLQCTYSDDASGACSNVQQEDGNFGGDVTGRPHSATFIPIVMTVSASTPTPSVNAASPPQGSAANNTTMPVAISQSTFNQTSQTDAVHIPTSTTTQSAVSTTQSSEATNRNVAEYWMVLLFTIVIWVCGA